MKILITTNKINWLMFLYYIAISTMAYLSNTFVAKVHKKAIKADVVIPQTIEKIEFSVL